MRRNGIRTCKRSSPIGGSQHLPPVVPDLLQQPFLLPPPLFQQQRALESKANLPNLSERELCGLLASNPPGLSSVFHCCILFISLDDDLAWCRLRTCSFRHSSRKCPLNDSTQAFWLDLPSPIKEEQNLTGICPRGQARLQNSLLLLVLNHFGQNHGPSPAGAARSPKRGHPSLREHGTTSSNGCNDFQSIWLTILRLMPARWQSFHGIKKVCLASNT